MLCDHSIGLFASENRFGFLNLREGVVFFIIIEEGGNSYYIMKPDFLVFSGLSYKQQNK